MLKSAENYVVLSLLLKGGGALQTTAGGSALTSERRWVHANYFDIPLVWIYVYDQGKKVKTATPAGDGFSLIKVKPKT